MPKDKKKKMPKVKRYVPGKDRVRDLNLASGFESMIKRYLEGKIVLDESFVEEQKQRIFECRYPWGESPGPYIPFDEVPKYKEKMITSSLFPAGFV